MERSLLHAERLQSAAASGDGWAFSELRRGLHRARLSGMTPWEAYDHLGEELGVDELRELVASSHLAGRDSLFGGVLCPELSLFEPVQASITAFARAILRWPWHLLIGNGHKEHRP